MNTKICYKCKQELTLDNFTKDKSKVDGHAYICKECKRQYDNKHYRDNMQAYKQQNKNIKIRNLIFIFEFLSKHPCEICKEPDPIVLEFDHLNPSEKDKNVSDLAKNSSLKRIKDEISKCRVLCANCHRRHTAIQQNWNILKYIKT